MKRPNQNIENKVVACHQRHVSLPAILSDWFTVKIQSEKPVKAGLAIPYKGFRFYIEDNGVSSKRTMGVLNYLVRVNIQAAGAPNTPVQNLPVGR